MMVPYAGQDPRDRPFGKGGSGCSTYPAKRNRGLMMFKAGLDTLDIANAVRVNERTVLRWITEERSERLGLPNPYEAAS